MRLHVFIIVVKFKTISNEIIPLHRTHTVDIIMKYVIILPDFLI
jgi:hypothetical protein